MEAGVYRMPPLMTEVAVVVHRGRDDLGRAEGPAPMGLSDLDGLVYWWFR